MKAEKKKRAVREKQTIILRGESSYETVKKSFVKIYFVDIFALTAITANAQDARLRFEKLNQLEGKARDVVEVNIDGKLLDLAKRVMVKTNDPNAKKSQKQLAV